MIEYKLIRMLVLYMHMSML